MSKPDAPEPPDPRMVARAQTEQNTKAALLNAALNRINTNTPLGSQSFDITGTDPRTGAPIYEQNISLDPQVEQAFRQQLAQGLELGDFGSDLISSARSVTGQPFSFGNLPARGSLDTSGLPAIPGADDLEGFRGRTEQALFDRHAAILDPQFERREEGLRTRLANQGIVEGSEAFRNAMQDFDQSRELAFRQARNEAIAGGGEEAERMFGIGSSARGQRFGEELTGATFDNQTRNQALSEALLGRQLPLQELAAVRGMMSPVDMPQFQGPAQVGTAPADITGAINNQYQGQLDAFNAKMQSRNALLGGLFGLGGAAILA